MGGWYRLVWTILICTSGSFSNVLTRIFGSVGLGLGTTTLVNFCPEGAFCVGEGLKIHVRASDRPSGKGAIFASRSENLRSGALLSRRVVPLLFLTSSSFWRKLFPKKCCLGTFFSAADRERVPVKAIPDRPDRRFPVWSLDFCGSPRERFFALLETSDLELEF